MDKNRLLELLIFTYKEYNKENLHCYKCDEVKKWIVLINDETNWDDEETIKPWCVDCLDKIRRF